MKNKLLKNLNQKGIAHHLLLIILAVVAVVGATGFFVWQRQRSNNLSADAAEKSIPCNRQTVKYEPEPWKTSKNSSSARQCIRPLQDLLTLYAKNYSKNQAPPTSTKSNGIFNLPTYNSSCFFQLSIGSKSKCGTWSTEDWTALCMGVSYNSSLYHNDEKSNSQTFKTNYDYEIWSKAGCNNVKRIYYGNKGKGSYPEYNPRPD